MIPARSLRLLLSAIVAFLLLADPSLSDQDRGFPVPGVPYGLAHDGQFFWFTELTGRKLYRADSRGRLQSYFYGNRYIYGIRYSPYDGYIYAGSRQCYYRYNPITGKQMDRISVPVDRVAGIAFGPGVLYFLEKGNGKVHVYSPDAGRVLYTGSTGIREARDIAFHRGQIWITEGNTGLIHRFEPDGFQPTGSLEAPSRTLRGLTFVNGELWILDRDGLRLEPVFFSEGPNFIAGQEKNHSLLYRVKRSNDQKTLLILLPASNRGQRAGSPLLSGNYDVSYLSDGTRIVIIPPLPEGAGPSEIEFRLPVSLRSVHYLYGAEDAPKRTEQQGCYVPVKQGPVDMDALECRNLYQKEREPVIPGPAETVAGGRSMEFLDSVHDLELIRIPQEAQASLIFTVDEFRSSLSLNDLTPAGAALEVYLQTQ